MSTTVDVKDLSGKTVGTADLPEEWFAAEVKPHVMHEVVTAQLANARQGTHKTKTRGEARGGGRKPWRQKGTGRARHGSIRSPIWVGGGVAHGRTPKDWSVRVNKKVKRSALRSALSDRANGGDVVVVRELSFEAPRTKDAVAALAALGTEDRSVLVVLADQDVATRRSFRNLQHAHVLTVDQLNTLDVVKRDVLVIDEAALDLIGTGRRAGDADEATTDEDTAEAQEVEA
jgi:large subunit ribosomal protein L4